jgi:beta-xylosidase
LSRQRTLLPQSPAAAVLILLALICFGTVPTDNRKAVWVGDNGDGTYKNPIIFADYSDPDAIRVGDDFYLTASSFNSAPGLPVLHSKDLVNWTIIGHVFSRQQPLDVYKKVQHGNGVWAPALRYHNGEFYVFYPDPDIGIYMAKAKSASGPWSAPLLIKPAKGAIDPCPFWDDDGRAWLVHAWAKSRAGINSILTINRMNGDGKAILDEGRVVFDGHANHPTIEGPKLCKRNGYYYIFAPAGGVSTGWQTVLRSKNIVGPYEDRVVMDQGTTQINGPHQGALVDLKSGESWFIHFQDRGPYGRVVHLQPVRWVNDWPVIGLDPDGDGKGEPVLTYRKPDVGHSYPIACPQTTDEFTSGNLGLQWQWQANYEEGWMSLSARPGWLRLRSVAMPAGAANLWSAPNLLMQKLPAPEFTLTTRLEFDKLADGDRAGLVVMGTDYSFVAAERTSTGYQLRSVRCTDANASGKEIERGVVDCSGHFVLLRVKVRSGAICDFSYSFDGERFIQIGDSFAARAGRWVGAKVGLFCVAGGRVREPSYADFDWFRFE